MSAFVVGVSAFAERIFLDDCIKAIVQSSVSPQEICIVDNRGDLDPRHFRSLGMRCEVISPIGNLGVAESWNVVRRRYPEFPIIFVRDDVLVATNTFRDLLNAPPGAGVTIAEGAAAIRSEAASEEQVPIDWPCFLHQPEATRLIGEFDKFFWPCGYEDVDYAIRLKKAGTSNAVARAASHFERKNTGAYCAGRNDPHDWWIAEYVRWNRDRLDLKWGDAKAGSAGNIASRPFAKAYDGKQVDESELYLQRVLINGRYLKGVEVICEHLATLKRYAAECRHVTEFGRQNGHSTCALLAGHPTTLVSYDIVQRCHGPANKLYQLCDRTELRLISADTGEVRIEPTDLLFVDSKHTYDHLRSELAHNADQVRRYIILHDTEVYAVRGDHGEEGIGRALKEFLECSPEWTVKEHFRNNHGLTVLSRS